MQLTGLDAALGLADVQEQLERAATGDGDPVGYFSLFRNSELIGKDSHTWLRNTVVTSFDDHDQVRKGAVKSRFGARPDARRQLLPVLALNVLTLGIPCLYYGTEQLLDGAGGPPNADRYIREAMFGGEFGAFRSRGRHVFDEDAAGYLDLAALLALRASEPALRRGRQYLREISGDGVGFALPTGFGGPVRGVVAWSRILADREVRLRRQHRSRPVAAGLGDRRRRAARRRRRAPPAARGPPRPGRPAARRGSQRCGRRRSPCRPAASPRTPDRASARGCPPMFQRSDRVVGDETTACGSTHRCSGAYFGAVKRLYG